MLAFDLFFHSAQARGQGLAIAPTCGTTSTHFVLSGAGWPTAPKGCPDTCITFVSVCLDGGQSTCYSAPVCSTSFAVDLATIPSFLNGLAVGQHTLTATGGYECSNDGGSSAGPIRACFEIVADASSAWDTVRTNAAATTIDIKMKPGQACDIPLCDSIRLIQVIRMRGRHAGSPLRLVSFAEQYAFDTSRSGLANFYDAYVTSSGYTVDFVRNDAMAPYTDSTGNKHTNTALEVHFTDTPRRSDLSYPSDIDTLIFDFELNALCTAGEGAGQWLGQVTWSWERAKGAPSFLGTVLPGTAGRGQPSAPFNIALVAYELLSGYRLPTPPRPSKGSPTCP